jgi:hypothetical protein
LQIKIARGEEARSPNRAPRVRFRWTAEIFSAILWAQVLDASTLRDSRLGGVNPSIFKVTRGEEARSLIARHVSAPDGRLRSSRLTVGPGPRRSRHFATRGLEELSFDLQCYEGRGGEEPNRAPRVRFRWTAEIFSALLWARVLGRSRHFATRGLEELSFDLQCYEGRGGEEPNRAPRVRFRWTAEIFSARLWAQALDALGTSWLRELEYRTLASFPREVPRRDGQRRLTPSGYFL